MRVVTRDRGQERPVDGFGDYADWLATASSDATYALDTGGVAHPIHGLSGPAPVAVLLEHAVEVTLPAEANPFDRSYDWTLREEYMWGGCDLFACALRRLVPEGRLYAMQEPDRQDRSRRPMLIHAGLLLSDGTIADVKGIHGLKAWTATWRRKAETRKATCGVVEATDLDVLQGCRPGERITDGAISLAIPHAEFVARIVGLVGTRPNPSDGDRRDVPAPAP